MALTKKQADEGLLQFAFSEKGSKIGVAEFPVRTLISKHYREPTSTSSSSNVVKPRIETSTDHWPGFKAQLIKSDTVRGAVYIEPECTGFPAFNDLMSNFKTFYIGVDNLLYLAQTDTTKLASYLSKDIVKSLQIATLVQQTQSAGSGSIVTPKRRNRGSTRTSKSSIPEAVSHLALAAALEEHGADPDDRYLLLALWRQLFSSNPLVQRKLISCGVVNLMKKLLLCEGDAELIIHCLEGIKYFFIYPDIQSNIIKKGIAKKMVDIVSQGANNPHQAQVVMRVLDVFPYFEGSGFKDLVDMGLPVALNKLVVDSGAFLALRTKALDTFKIFPADLQATVFACGIAKSLTEVLSSTSSRSTHQALVTRVLNFMAHIASISTIMVSEKLFAHLITFLTSKHASEANKLLALSILSDALADNCIEFINSGLPKTLLNLLAEDATTPNFRIKIMEHMNLAPYFTESALGALRVGGTVQAMFLLLSRSTITEETRMARDFLSYVSIATEDIATSGLLACCEALLANVDAFSSSSHLESMVFIVGCLNKLLKAPAPQEIQNSKLPELVHNIFTMLTDPSNLSTAYHKLPANVVSVLLNFLETFDDATFFKYHFEAPLLKIALAEYTGYPQQIPRFCSKLLEAKSQWVGQISNADLIETIRTNFENSEDTTDICIDIMRGLPADYGHVDLIYSLLSSSKKNYIFLNLFDALPTFECYQAWCESPKFMETVLSSSALDAKCPLFIQALLDVSRKSEAVQKKLEEHQIIDKLVTLLGSVIFMFKKGSYGCHTEESILKLRSNLFSIIKEIPTIIDYFAIDNIRALMELLQPASGSDIIRWVLSTIVRLIDLDVKVLVDNETRETLFNMVQSGDMVGTQGDQDSIYCTEDAIEGWAVLCKFPNYLQWLESLPHFFKIVTSWFFCKHSSYQMLALGIMEPVRWARVGAKTAEEFEAWRHSYNMGRLAYCASLPNIDIKEVSKLASSFSHNGVVQDLSWTRDPAQMQIHLDKYLEIEAQLKPKSQAEQTKEYSTLVDWLKFLRVCTHSSVKRRFVGLLDTFHDSIWFLPDTKPAGMDWHKYYQVDSPAPIQAETVASRFLNSKASSTLLRTSNSGMLKVSKGAIPIAPQLPSTVNDSTQLHVGTWKTQFAAHFQVARYWQFSHITRQCKLIDVANTNHTTYELCYDTYMHGWNQTALNQRTLGLSRLLILIKLAPRVCPGKDGVLLGIMIPSTFVWSNPSRYPKDATPTASMTLFSFKNISHEAQTSNFRFLNVQACSYAFDAASPMTFSAGRLAAQYPDISLDLEDHKMTFFAGSWHNALWGLSEYQDVKVEHVQIFRLANVMSNSRITVMTRIGFNNGSIPAVSQSAANKDAKQAGVNKSETIPEAEAEEEVALPTDTDSFMNRHLANTLNAKLKQHYKNVITQYPGLSYKIPSGPTPTWIRIFRYSAASESTEASALNLIDVLQKANATKSPIIGIVKMKPPTREDGSSDPKGSHIFGFYIHAGLEKASVGTMINDPLAALFSLRGPGSSNVQFLPVNIEEAANAYKLVNSTTIQFGVGTDLMLNINEHSMSFANPGYSYSLPDEIPFMSTSALHLFTNEAVRTWEFEDVELYLRITPKGKAQSPYPSLGHLLRLLGQKDIATLQQVRWRLKYLMLSGSIENKRQILDEIRRAQLADSQLKSSIPSNNFTKKIEFPGMDMMNVKLVAINGVPCGENSLVARILEHVNGTVFTAPDDVVPWSLTFAVLPPSMDKSGLTPEDINAIKLDDLPFLTHALLTPGRLPNTDAVRQGLIIASDSIPSQAELDQRFPLHVPFDNWLKRCISISRDHFDWYERNYPSALDATAQFRIGPLLIPAEVLQKEDSGIVSKIEDDYWSFLQERKDEVTKLVPVPLPPTGQQTFVEEYTIDATRSKNDPIAAFQLESDKNIGTVTLSAPVRARYITLRMVPHAVCKNPISLSSVRFLGYHPPTNHYLAPPYPAALSELLPVYSKSKNTSDQLKIEHSGEDTEGILHWLLTKKAGNKESQLLNLVQVSLSHPLFDTKTMTQASIINGNPGAVTYWGGSTPTWLTVRFNSIRVRPNAFMLRHGYNKNNSFIQNFVLLGKKDASSEWVTIADFPGHYHTYAGQTFTFNDFDASGCDFMSEFRIMQKGMYYMGPNHPGAPFLCLSQFEIFGDVLLESETSSKSVAVPEVSDINSELGFDQNYGPTWSSVVRSNE